MNGKRTITIMLLLAVLLSACGGQTATETPAPTDTVPVPTEAVATDTVAPVEQASATPEGTFTPTVAPTRPPNDPACTNNASFVADVTIPDNTELTGGEVFTKTWRIMNTGTCIWASDYTLTHYSEQLMNAPASVPLPVTFPGQTADISVELTAPNTVGTHRANFVISNPAGLIMSVNDDSRLWLIIVVRSTSAATAAPTVTTSAGATSAPVATATSSGSSSGGTGFANVTCSYSIDQIRLLDVITAVNAYRTSFGLPAYNTNTQLVRAAQAHANDMACNSLTGHTGSNNSTIQSRVAASGYTAAFSSENVYFSNPPLTGQQVVDWWINDQGDQNHRLNLISDTYIEIGVGYAFFNNTGYYVIVFATP